MRHHLLAFPALVLVLAATACAPEPKKPAGIFDLSNGLGASPDTPRASGLTDGPHQGGRGMGDGPGGTGGMSTGFGTGDGMNGPPGGFGAGTGTGTGTGGSGY